MDLMGRPFSEVRRVRRIKKTFSGMFLFTLYLLTLYLITLLFTALFPVGFYCSLLKCFPKLSTRMNFSPCISDFSTMSPSSSDLRIIEGLAKTERGSLSYFQETCESLSSFSIARPAPAPIHDLRDGVFEKGVAAHGANKVADQWLLQKQKQTKIGAHRYWTSISTLVNVAWKWNLRSDDFCEVMR